DAGRTRLSPRRERQIAVRLPVGWWTTRRGMDAPARAAGVVRRDLTGWRKNQRRPSGNRRLPDGRRQVRGARIPHMTADERGLTVTYDGPVAHLTLSRPAKLNALDDGVRQALA